MKQVSLGVDVGYNKKLNLPFFLFIDSSQMRIKVTKLGYNEHFGTGHFCSL
jgi:hypothetical protein